VNSALSGVPVARRKTAAATLALFAVLFLAVGAVAASGTGTAPVRAFAVIALLVSALLGLLAWGVAPSVKLELGEQGRDAAIGVAVAAHGGTALACGCGHDHDPDELHVTDACRHDGAGEACEHDCETCVLAAMRPSPTATRGERLSR
jgi:hypothetical protein